MTDTRTVRERISAQMQRIAATTDFWLKAHTKHRARFAVIVPVDGRAEWVSNCSNDQIVEMMGALIERWQDEAGAQRRAGALIGDVESFMQTDTFKVGGAFRELTKLIDTDLSAVVDDGAPHVVMVLTHPHRLAVDLIYGSTSNRADVAAMLVKLCESFKRGYDIDTAQLSDKH